MGLIELCLLTLLSPQEPPVSTAPETPRAAVADKAPSPEELQSLLSAERAGDKADIVVLRRLCESKSEAIAARAAWLLGRSKDPQATVLCGEVATGSPHAEARTQAMNALMLQKDASSLATAVTALQDNDRRVRTLAAQLLGRLRRPTAVDPLLTMIERSRTDGTVGQAPDVQAALLALNDIKAARSLLRAATAIHDSKVAGTGEALAFCFQSLSPELDKAQEITTLLAVLDHREPLLRRYAIGRLAEIGDPATANALEGRLGTESAELRPLVEVALGQVRSDRAKQSYDELERAMANLKTLGAMAESRWAALDETQRWLVGSVPFGLLVLGWVLRRWNRKRAAQNVAVATAALVAPSEEYLEQMSADAEQQQYEGENGDEEFAGAGQYEPHGTHRR
ncbi:MAG TPA: HEAT repeat domain-containing protein [Planctomycetota bacterium]